MCATHLAHLGKALEVLGVLGQGCQEVGLRSQNSWSAGVKGTEY